MRKLAIIVAVIAVAAVAAAGWTDAVVKRPIRLDAGTLDYVVPRGANLRGVISDLRARHILEGPGLLWRFYARVTRHEGPIKAGEYELSPGMTGASVLSLLRSGKVIQREITFVEGWTFRHWRERLAGQQGVEHTLADISGRDIMKQLGAGDISPEGQFFPDTYHFTLGESDLSILARAHERMTATLKEAWAHSARPPVLKSPYEALILASIVEKETGYAPDRPKIARVFINRLANNMRLQSDPTTIYGIKDFNGDLTRANLAKPTPYNTYVIRGLPPTPICNPGLDAIRSALNPDPGDYYYFVGRGDGRSEFSKTLKQHNDAVTRFQKAGRVDDYRSAPGGK